MLGRTYDEQVCSVARALEAVGERWSLLIVRDVHLGLHRFEDLRLELGIARNVLTTRLNHLVDAGVLERRPYSDHPQRWEYHLTRVGLELGLPIVALMQWGDRHLLEPGQRPPRQARHRTCHGTVDVGYSCRSCATTVPAREVEVLPAMTAPAAADRGA
ncbi:MAG: helix-turn-helix transcriptional regulator [Actinobacteria bacterium]|nr:helix-turn-helix transcriptional regulator [Actinomycetota bacterium]